MENRNDLLSESYNYLQKIGNNKSLMVGILLLASLYSCYGVYHIPNEMQDLFLNSYFKFIIFVIISFIASATPGLGVILAICVLVTLQVISQNQLLMDDEYFTEKFDNNTYSNEYKDEYLKNPLLKQNEKSQIGNYNLKLENPNEIYKNMIKKGKNLIEDSMDIEKELVNRYDKREDKIAKVTKLEGDVLVKSGINRLQESNEGEYNMKNDSNTNNNFVKFDKLINVYSDNNDVIQLFNELKNKFDELSFNYELNPEDFNNKINNIHDIEFELLVTIYNLKKDSMNIEQKNNIINNIKNIKEMKHNKPDNYHEEINNLLELLCM